MSSADEIWDFGVAQQGTLMQRTFTLGNVGYTELLTRLGTSNGLSVAGPTTRGLPPGDTATYTVTLNTQFLPTGPFQQTLTMRTSDPDNPITTVTVRGNVTAAPSNVAIDTALRLPPVSTAVSDAQKQEPEATSMPASQPDTPQPARV